MSFLKPFAPAVPESAPASPKKWTLDVHIWQGCDFFAWWRMLVRNRFALGWSFWWIAAIITPVSVGHTVLRLIQQAIFRKRLMRTKIDQAPLFIIGHWRSGTTFLHELLIRDPRHSFPNTFECLDPNDFLLTENWLPRLLGWMMPHQRPMDNMAAGWDRPQEDEFALCMLGQPSPYAHIAFPNRADTYDEAFDFAGQPPRVVRRWKRTFMNFLRQLTFKYPGRRLVLKSPPHTCRIAILKAMFPDARFLHIVRNPYVVFPSTVKLWKSLYRQHGMQRPTFEGLDEYVFRTFVRLYDCLERDRPRLDTARFYEVKYEDLVRDPLGELAKVYDRLELGDFSDARPHAEKYLASVRNYETNRYDLTPSQRAEITRRWGDVIRRYGYAIEDGSTAEAS